MDSNGNPAQGGERVAKVMARAGLCSRRDAEGWIKAGRVAVNGAVITSPALDVTPADRIEVDGQPLPERERTRLFLYHKPRGLVTTNADPEGRPTIFEALPQGLPRLISIGRLDLASEGLLLLTNDGALARALELPKTGWVRRYRARAHGSVEQQRLDNLKRGITVDGMRYGPIDASLDPGASGGSNIWLTIAIREGKNREVRNVLGALGLATNRLIRTAFGPFELGDLPEGAIEEISTRQLRDALGSELATQIGVDFSGPLPERVPRTAGAPPPRPSRRERFEEREQRPERDERQQREARFDPDRRRERDERRGRDARPDRDSRFDRGERRDRDAAPAEGGAPPKKRITKHHGDTRVWRGGDKPLRRKFHGDRREQREDEKPSGTKREGVVADRKGRTVVVERFGEPKTPPAERPRRYARPGPGDERARDERPRGKFGGDRPGGKFGGDRPLGKSGDERPRGKFGDRPHGKPGGGRSFGRRPPRRDRSGGPRPARPK